jgi:hypothetical protein
VQMGQGKHVPLWDTETREAILLEMQRRSTNYKGRVSNEFTGLVKCWCGAPMWRHENGPRGYRLIWRCSTTKSAAGHNSVFHEILKEKMIDKLERDLKPYMESQGKPQTKQKQGTQTEKVIAELTDKLTRLEDAYLAGQWDLARFTRRKEELERALEEEQDKLRKSDQHQAIRKAWLAEIQSMQELDDMRHWFETTSPVEINKSLHILLEKIIIGKHSIELEFKA